VRDRFGIFGTVTRFRELSLLSVMMLRIPNTTVKSQALVDFIAEWTDLNAPPAPDISDH